MQKVFKFIFILAVLTAVYQSASAQSVKYNEFSGIACHNCYQPEYASGLDEILKFTKVIEIDIWDSEMFFGITADIFGAGRLEGDWYVKHDINFKGNKNCFGGTFKKCLLKLKKWSDKNPGHDVITIFIDKKENWSSKEEQRSPENIDKLISSIFPSDKLFTPSHLVKHNNIPEWPLLDSLKSKFVFVITDAAINISRRNILDEYLTARSSNAICFAAPKISDESQVKSISGISANNLNQIVFYNLRYENRNIIPTISSLGYVARIYNSPETPEAFKNLVQLKANFIALYNFKIDIASNFKSAVKAVNQPVYTGK